MTIASLALGGVALEPCSLRHDLTEALALTAILLHLNLDTLVSTHQQIVRGSLKPDCERVGLVLRSCCAATP